jgi:Ferric reductase like transmembrane component
MTKRFAQVAAALLPFHYLLGTPSRLSPLPYLFRTSPSSLYNPYHRIHALLIFFLLANHATWYLNFYFWASKLPGRLFDLDVLLGLSMATTFTIMATLARQAVRYDPKRRPWFVRSHFIAAGLIPCLLFFHAPPARWYAVEMLLVYAGVAFERVMRRRDGNSG